MTEKHFPMAMDRPASAAGFRAETPPSAKARQARTCLANERTFGSDLRGR
jgi:hypothetical protein